MDIGEAVAHRIQSLCEERGISINRLAAISGLTQSTVDSILRGKSKNPTLATIARICNGLGMSVTEFFGDPVFSRVDDSECP